MNKSSANGDSSLIRRGPEFYRYPVALWIYFASAAYVVAAENAQSKVEYATDMRASYSATRRNERDTSNQFEHDASIRFRHGATATVTESLHLKIRAAAIIDTDVKRIQFSLNAPVISGNVTLDTLYLAYRLSEMFRFNIGRLQTEFELDSVVKDSLSRHDSSGVSVDWTDGVHTIVGREDSPRLHFIMQVNHGREPTNDVGTQGPVSYEGNSARHTYYLGLELPETESFTQLLVDITVIPDALYPLGLGVGSSDALVALTLKVAADVTVRDFTLHPFLEAGVMNSTPLNSVLGLQDSSREAGRFALVTGFDLIDLGSGDLGIQIAWIQPGFLISPDYPANSVSVETRYEWAFGPKSVFDIRYRYREDMKRYLSSIESRRDWNVQARIRMEF